MDLRPLNRKSDRLLPARPCDICGVEFQPRAKSGHNQRSCGALACRKAMQRQCKQNYEATRRIETPRAPDSGAPLCPAHGLTLLFGTNGNGLTVQACSACASFTLMPRRVA